MQTLSRSIYTTRGTVKSAYPVADIVEPVVEVEIFGQLGHFGTGQRFDPALNLISVSTNDNLSQSTASATVTLTGGVWGGPATLSWLDLLRPMDLVIVRLGKSGVTTLRTVFVGYLVTVTETADVANSTQPTRSVSLVCSDLAYGLVFPQLSIFPNTVQIPTNEAGQPQVQQWSNLFVALQKASVSTVGNPVSWLTAFLTSMLGYTVTLTDLNPSQIILYLMQYALPVLFNPTTKLALPGATGSYSYTDMLSLYFCDTSAFALAAFTGGPMDQSLWELFLSMTNTPWFEFWGGVRSNDQLTDLSPSSTGAGGFGAATSSESSFGATGPVIRWGLGNKLSPGFGPDGARYVLVLRPTPFDQDSWQLLETQELLEEDLASYSLGMTQQQVQNIYLSYPEAMNQGLSGIITRLYPGIADPDSALTYGCAPAIFPLYGLLNPTAHHEFSPESTAPWTKRLYDWYWKNPLWMQGAMQVKGDGRYRKGQRLNVPWWPMDFYIEGVSHSFVAFQSYSTTLTVSRGSKPGQRWAPSLSPMASETVMVSEAAGGNG